MKKIMGIFMLFGLLVLAACGEEDDTTDAGTNINPIETSFNSAETAESGDEMTLSVTVVQGQELVEDADEVVFEVWQSGHRDKSEMIQAKHTEDGVYEAETSFDEEGLYFAQAHTTARRLHAMPKQEITVGNPAPETIVPDDSTDADSKMNMDDHSNGH